MHVLGIAIVKNCFRVTEDILYPLFGDLIGSRNVAFYCGLLNLTTKKLEFISIVNQIVQNLT